VLVGAPTPPEKSDEKSSPVNDPARPAAVRPDGHSQQADSSGLPGPVDPGRRQQEHNAADAGQDGVGHRPQEQLAAAGQDRVATEHRRMANELLQLQRQQADTAHQLAEATRTAREATEREHRIAAANGRLQAQLSSDRSNNADQMSRDQASHLQRTQARQTREQGPGALQRLFFEHRFWFSLEHSTQ
jgi:hypothetical protein